MRALLRHRLVEPHISRALHARLVRQSARFFLREELSGGIRVYALAGSSVRVAVEHRTPDVMVLDELFYSQVYEPPAAVARAIASLGPSPRITDLGANIGMFGAWALMRWPRASMTAFEPDSRNAGMLRLAVDANTPHSSWTVVEAAAVARAREVSFVGGGFATSHAGGPDEDGVMVAGVDALPHMVGCDFLKIDIEGGEWELLADPRIRDTEARVVVLEYHPDGCPSDTPEQTAQGYLVDAGFQVITSLRTSPAHGVLWGWKS